MQMKGDARKARSIVVAVRDERARRQRGGGQFPGTTVRPKAGALSLCGVRRRFLLERQ